MSETFGQRLARLRKEKKMTQDDLAKKIVISPQAVSKWENDISSPDILVLSSLADILGVSVDELLGREEKTNEEGPIDLDKDQPKEEETVETEVVDEDPRERVKEERNKKGDRVIIDDTGIHVTSDDEEVHVSKKGIYVHDGKETIKVNGPRPIFWITQSSLFGLALIGYILMGLLWKDQTMGWKMGWILFLLPPTIWSVFEAIRHRRFCEFAYPVAVTAIYCFLGFLGNYLGFEGWTFYWFLFITIPAYYMIFGPIDARIHRNDPPKVIIGNHDDDDDDDDDDD